MSLGNYDAASGNFYLIPASTGMVQIVPSTSSHSEDLTSYSSTLGSMGPNLTSTGGFIFTTSSSEFSLASASIDGGFGGDLGTDVGGDPGNYNGADNNMTPNSLIASQANFSSVNSIQADINQDTVSGDTAALNQMVADYNGAKSAVATYVNSTGPQSGNIGAGWAAIAKGSLACFAASGGGGAAVALLAGTVSAPVGIVVLGAASVATYQECFTPEAVTVTPDMRAAINDGIRSLGAALNSIVNHFGALGVPNSVINNTLPTAMPTMAGGVPSAAMIHSAAMGLFANQQQIASVTGSQYHYTLPN